MKVADISVEYIQHCGSDLSVVNAARVSFDKESGWVWDDVYLEYQEGVLKPQDEKLINYLAAHKHLSPFNHAFITVRVKAPIFVARQLQKHEYMPWNEVSRRYVDDEPEFYLVDYWREKADNVKQGSKDTVFDVYQPNYQLDIWHKDILNQTLALYNTMIQDGVAPEQARMVLPQNMMTSWYWSGTLGAFAKMLGLRLDPHAQKESRIVAEQVRDIVQPLFPVSLNALLKGLNENNPGNP